MAACLRGPNEPRESTCQKKKKKRGNNKTDDVLSSKQPPPKPINIYIYTIYIYIWIYSPLKTYYFVQMQGCLLSHRTRAIKFTAAKRQKKYIKYDLQITKRAQRPARVKLSELITNRYISEERRLGGRSTASIRDAKKIYISEGTNLVIYATINTK